MATEDLDALWEQATPAQAQPSTDENLDALWETSVPVKTTPADVPENNDYQETGTIKPTDLSFGDFVDFVKQGQVVSIVKALNSGEYTNEVAERIAGSIQNISNAMKAVPGLTANIAKSIVMPSFNKAMTDTQAQELGYKDAEEFNDLQMQEYKRTLLKGVSDAEKLTGEVMSSIVDPLAVASGAYGLTARGIARLLKMGAAGAGYSGPYEAFEQLVDEGEITSPGAVLGWTVFGGIAGAGLGAGTILAEKVVRTASKFINEKSLSSFEKKVQSYIDEGRNPQAAYDKALYDMGMTADEVANTVDAAGRKMHVRMRTEPKKPAYQNPLIDEFETRRTESVITRAVKAPFRAAGEVFNKYAEPISSRIAKINPGLANSIRKLEQRIHLDTNRWREAVVPFLTSAKGLSKDLQLDLHKALINENFHRAKEIISTLPNKVDALKQFEAAKGTLKEIREAYIKAGVDVAELQNYWPRPLKNGAYQKLRERLTPDQASFIDRRLAEAQKLKGGKLSFKEESDVINSALLGITPQGLKGASAAKQRVLPTITDDLYEFYAGLDDGIMSYIDHAALSINERIFFGRNIDSKTINHNPTASIGSFVADLMRRGEIAGSDKHTLEELMHARFGYKDNSAGWQNIKNLFYMTKLAQVDSTLTQLADLGISAYVNGFFRTLWTVLRPKGTSWVTAEEIGAKKISQEFGTTVATARTLDKLFWATGFSRIDKLGKEVLINSALAKNKSLVKSAKGIETFKKKWGQWYGKETDNLIKDLQNGKMTDNVKLLLWNELSDVQPISLSEMPEGYLRASGGRLFYALKSFTLKQFDLLRRESLAKIASRNPKQQLEGMMNMARFGMLFTGSNMGVDQMKNFIVGRELDDLDDSFVKNIWKNFGLSQYLVEKMQSHKDKEGLTKWEGLASTADWILGPVYGLAETGQAVYTDLANIGNGMWSLSNSEGLREVPLVGRVLYNMFGAGKTKYEEKQMQKFMGAGLEDEDGVY